MLKILGQTTCINVRKVLWIFEMRASTGSRKMTAAVLPQRKRMLSEP